MKTRKLIRDKIPTLMESLDQRPQYYIADNEEFLSMLYLKVKEEFDEFIQNPCEEEIANIYEVISTLCSYFKLDGALITKVKKRKLKELGGFKHKFILHVKIE